MSQLSESMELINAIYFSWLKQSNWFWMVILGLSSGLKWLCSMRGITYKQIFSRIYRIRILKTVFSNVNLIELSSIWKLRGMMIVSLFCRSNVSSPWGRWRLCPKSKSAEWPLHNGVQCVRVDAVLQRDQRAQDPRREECLQRHLHKRTLRIHCHWHHHRTGTALLTCDCSNPLSGFMLCWTLKMCLLQLFGPSLLILYSIFRLIDFNTSVHQTYFGLKKLFYRRTHLSRLWLRSYFYDSNRRFSVSLYKGANKNTGSSGSD